MTPAAASTEELGGTDIAGRLLQRGQARTAEDTAGEQDLHRAIARDEGISVKITGGRPLPDGYFRDTVVVYRRLSTDSTQLCSGVLVSADAVLTAAHCACDMDLQNMPPSLNASNRPNVYLGDSHFSPQGEISGQSVPIASAHLLNPNFCAVRDSSLRSKDIALLRLDPERAGRFVARPWQAHFEGTGTEFSPARIAPTFLYLSPMIKSLTIVGFGEDDRADMGRKRYARVEISSRICGSTLAKKLFGCSGGTEAVLAGYFGQDTCRGDSGGPAYAVMGKDYYLVALTSRAIDPWGRCGAGGVYSLITPAVVKWMRKLGVSVNAYQ